MKKFEVISEFVDVQTNDRIFPAAPGDDVVTFTPHDEDQATRLVAAAVIREPKAKSADGARAKPEKGEGDKA